MKRFLKKILKILAIFFALSVILSSCTLRVRDTDRTKDDDRDTETEDSVLEEKDETTKSEDDSGPEEALAAFLEALKASDFEALSELSDGTFSRDNLIHGEWPISSVLFEATFGDMTWTIGETEMLSGTAADIEVSVRYPNHFGAADEVIRDRELMVEVTQPIVLFYSKRMSEKEAFLQYSDQIAILMVEEIKNTEVFTSAESAFRLNYDDADQVWRVVKIPDCFFDFSDFYSFDPMNRSDQENTLAIMMTAAKELFEEKKIERVEYEALLTGWLKMSDPAEYSVDEVKDACESSGWYDLEAAVFVDHYATSAENIFYRIYFNREMMGLVLKYEVFNKGGTTSLGSSEIMMLDEKWVTIGIRGNPGFPADTFRIVVRLSDGTVLKDSSVEIKAS